MTLERTVSFIGLPRTGKSTYLGALWMLVQDPSIRDLWEDDVQGDRSYVDSLGRQVANGVEISRTEVDSDHSFRMRLGFADRGTAQLNIPDLSGEAVRELVERRVWRKVLADALERSQALMLFLHPDHISLPVPVSLGGHVTTGAESAQPEEPEFAPANACTAAKVIEVLENVLELKGEAWPLPVAIVVSAWDRVGTSATPATWLESRLPGVSGLLETNPDVVRHSVFGVSAQGGRLPQDQDLLKIKTVSEKVFAAAADGTPTTLYAPLEWAVWS